MGKQKLIYTHLCFFIIYLSLHFIVSDDYVSDHSDDTADTKSKGVGLGVFINNNKFKLPTSEVVPKKNVSKEFATKYNLLPLQSVINNYGINNGDNTNKPVGQIDDARESSVPVSNAVSDQSYNSDIDTESVNDQGKDQAKYKDFHIEEDTSSHEGATLVSANRKQESGYINELANNEAVAVTAKGSIETVVFASLPEAYISRDNRSTSAAVDRNNEGQNEQNSESNESLPMLHQDKEQFQTQQATDRYLQPTLADLHKLQGQLPQQQHLPHEQEQKEQPLAPTNLLKSHVQLPNQQEQNDDALELTLLQNQQQQNEEPQELPSLPNLTQQQNQQQQSEEPQELPSLPNLTQQQNQQQQNEEPQELPSLPNLKQQQNQQQQNEEPQELLSLPNLTQQNQQQQNEEPQELPSLSNLTQQQNHQQQENEEPQELPFLPNLTQQQNQQQQNEEPQKLPSLPNLTQQQNHQQQNEEPQELPFLPNMTQQQNQPQQQSEEAQELSPLTDLLQQQNQQAQSGQQNGELLSLVKTTHEENNPALSQPANWQDSPKPLATDLYDLNNEMEPDYYSNIVTNWRKEKGYRPAELEENISQNFTNAIEQGQISNVGSNVPSYGDTPLDNSDSDFSHIENTKETNWRPAINVLDKDNDDGWFEENEEDEEYDGNKENDKEVDEAGSLGLTGSDVRDEDYDASKWTDGDGEQNTDNENDDQYDSEATNSDIIEDVVDEEMARRNRPPTAPTSMVLFYTWMIVAVLIFAVGISMYQSRCKGVRIPGTRSSSSGNDRKRLLDNEFV